MGFNLAFEGLIPYVQQQNIQIRQCMCERAVHAVAQLAEAQWCKPESRGMNSRWCHSARTTALGMTQPLTEMSARNISWSVKAAGEYGWQPYHLHASTVLKSGSLNLLEPSRPVQACVYKRAAINYSKMVIKVVSVLTLPVWIQSFHGTCSKRTVFTCRIRQCHILTTCAVVFNVGKYCIWLRVLQKFDVRFPCNYIMYVKFITNLLRSIIICLLMLRHVSALIVGHVLGVSFNICSLYFNLNVRNSTCH